METRTIRKIDILSAAKIGAIIGAVVGFITGLFFSLASALGLMASAAEGGQFGGFEAILFGVGAVIVLPIFYSITVAIAVALEVLVYNIAAKWVGGIKIELE